MVLFAAEATAAKARDAEAVLRRMVMLWLKWIDVLIYEDRVGSYLGWCVENGLGSLWLSGKDYLTTVSARPKLLYLLPSPTLHLAMDSVCHSQVVDIEVHRGFSWISMTKAERVLSLNGKFIIVVNVDVHREMIVSKDVMLVRLQHVSTLFRSHHTEKEKNKKTR